MCLLAIFVVASQLLTVYGDPAVTISPNPASVGGDVVLTCSDPLFLANSPYVWSKDNSDIFNQAGAINIINNGKYFEESNQDTEVKLKIVNLTLSDSGEYVCNINFQPSPSVSLQVEEPTTSTTTTTTPTTTITTTVATTTNACICHCGCPCKDLWDEILGCEIVALICCTVVICEGIFMLVKLKNFCQKKKLWVIGIIVVGACLGTATLIWFIVMKVKTDDCCDESSDDDECCDECPGVDDYCDPMKALLGVDIVTIASSCMCGIIWGYIICKHVCCKDDESPSSNGTNPVSASPKHSTMTTGKPPPSTIHPTRTSDPEPLRRRPQPPPPTDRPHMTREGSRDTRRLSHTWGSSSPSSLLGSCDSNISQPLSAEEDDAISSKIPRDGSAISREDVTLKPLGPIPTSGNNATVQKRNHHDGEHTGMPNTRGLSAVFNEDETLGPSNRLTPISNVPEQEPKKKKKKKKKKDADEDETVDFY